MNIDIDTEQLAVAISISLLNKKFKWGMYDCNTTALMISDALFDTEMSESIVGSYDSKDGAIKKAEEIDFIEYLEENGFEFVNDNYFFPGDLLVVPESNWYAVHVYINNGKVLMTDIRDGITLQKISNFKNMMFLKYRKVN